MRRAASASPAVSWRMLSVSGSRGKEALMQSRFCTAGGLALLAACGSDGGRVDACRSPGGRVHGVGELVAEVDASPSIRFVQVGKALGIDRSHEPASAGTFT